MIDFFINNTESIFETILLVIALSLDTFVASFGYGSNKIKIPFICAFIISSVSMLTLIISFLFGSLTKSIIPAALTTGICFSLLFLLGLFKFIDSLVSIYIKKHPKYKSTFSFSLFHLNFSLEIKSPQVDDKKTKLNVAISFSETVSLALALSLDGLAAGFGAAFIDFNIIIVVSLSLIFNILAVVFGHFIGFKISQKISCDLSWISGAILIILAFLKLQ